MTRRILPLAALFMFLVAACGTARRGDTTTGPLTISSDKEAKGQQFFMTYCNKCHPGGAGGVGPALNNKPLPGAMIKTQVRLGAGAMPAFSREFLSDGKLDAIIAYLQAIRNQ